MLRLSRALDHVGLFARSIEDIALLGEQIVGLDERDPDTRPRARPPFVATAAQEPPLSPRFAFVRGPSWERIEKETEEAFAELAESLGDAVQQIDLPLPGDVLAWHRTLMEAEMAANLDLEWEKGRDKLSEPLRKLLERGRVVPALEYQRALARIPLLNDALAGIFENVDAILTPAAPGTAPKGLGATGDPSFCTLWTLCGMPAISLPLMQGGNGLPLGVQLVGPRHGDARLLRTANWLVGQARGEAQ
jgi:Asp-tRNA(Asn)/Glu-tRNA(Gln) amidotransferase A subunit family amidase